MLDFDGDPVVDENGKKYWEEVLFISAGDKEQTAALNLLLKDSFYIYETYAVGDSVFVRIRDLNNGESK